ncbi:hypothetical protein PHMEG_00022037 [Phytophthora megakarya]|uniref:Uncharacterized protein n=1 Tax=Phytophthora megakarya TaxID=4795 RepID=A0A225VJQ2_9STRA|nr:hypothetical protein PHMEG_00022037 [Phytophthora megakarya]
MHPFLMMPERRARNVIPLSVVVFNVLWMSGSPSSL